MHATRLVIKKCRSDNSVLRIILSKDVMAQAIKRIVTWSQNSFYKSAISIKAWPWPFPAVLLILTALLVVADLDIKSRFL
jgi:hypothetical protein